MRHTLFGFEGTVVSPQGKLGFILNILSHTMSCSFGVFGRFLRSCARKANYSQAAKNTHSHLVVELAAKNLAKNQAKRSVFAIF